jgi:ABC-type transporter MlaC component
MTPEQIKKHEPMNINNLYEAVPCKNFENILESDYHVQLEENRRDESIKLAADKYLTESYRPVTRESIEAFLREFGEKVATKMQDSIIDNASYDSEEEIIEIDYSCIEKDKQTAITELITQTLGQ